MLMNFAQKLYFIYAGSSKINFSNLEIQLELHDMIKQNF